MSLDLTYRFAADPRAIGPARSRLQSWLDDVGVVGTDACELVLVFSELAANAVSAASAVSSTAGVDAADGTIDLTGRCESGSGVVLEVTGPGAILDPAKMAPPMPGAGSERGRGFAIVFALTDRLEAERLGSETAVRAFKSVAGHRSRPTGQ